MKSEIFILLILSLSLFSTNLTISLILLVLLLIQYVAFLFFNGMHILVGVLIMIVFLTGLFVVFSYIVSTSPFEGENVFAPVPSLALFLFLTTFLVKGGKHYYNFNIMTLDFTFAGFVLMVLLVFFIVILIRATYSKGGAMRRNF